MKTFCENQGNVQNALGTGFFNSALFVPLPHPLKFLTRFTITTELILSSETIFSAEFRGSTENFHALTEENDRRDIRY